MPSNDERFKNRAGNTRNASPVRMAGGVGVVKASFKRPANTTPYAAGQIVLPANAQPMSFVAAREYATSFLLVKARLWKSMPDLAGAAFVLHLYAEKPTPVNPDGGVFSTDKSRAYIGSFDLFALRAFADGAHGVGAASEDGPVCVELPDEQRVIWGLLEVRGIYTPGSEEEFEVALELQQD